MSALQGVLQSRPMRVLDANRGMILPLGATLLIFVLLQPLPTQLMDVLLSANITVSVGGGGSTRKR